MKNIFLIFFLLPLFYITAQSGTLTGKVINEKGQPVFGASVLIVGTVRGASADETGNFEIKNLPEGTYSVQVSAISYEKKTVSNILINESTKAITIVLAEALIQTEQIIVSAGKYEQRVQDLTVSTAVLQPEVISKRNHLTFDDLLRYVPGV
ncbi:MAG: carboxypeptidase-like regulatory domain-containing protein, partial [Ignavibacteria bacterium]|nr:carboxypeptidase-like regulatory domain-containing protein [Ignavibacteria bacterium]